MSFFTIFLLCTIKKGDLENEHLKFRYWNKEDPAKRTALLSLSLSLEQNLIL